MIKQYKGRNEEFCNSYASPNIISYRMEDDEMDGACSMYRRGENCVQNFGPKPEGKIPFGRRRHR
jgi:hypothetical protein